MDGFSKKVKLRMLNKENLLHVLLLDIFLLFFLIFYLQFIN